ncbi:hypothetical protein D4R20_02115, partial [bacterium]
MNKIFLSMQRFFYISVLLLLYCSVSFAQINIPDTLKKSANINKTDTLKSPADTLKKAKSDIDARIDYKASDSVVFDLLEKKMYLYNKAELIYKDLKLNAGEIVFDQQEGTLSSRGIPDTAGNNTIIQLPIMFQGSVKYEGTQLLYNFQTQQGNISRGFSDAEIGYYFGEKIKKVTPEVFFIKDGLYTTSTDKQKPEYY